ncbi:MAG: electron transport complex subunit RsxA [Peptococcaceae bacterium]|nr:electron transport complex subunit RsxA [Peptococcaceae bacterium]
MEYVTLFISTVIVNNLILSRFLGLCIFFGVSQNLNASLSMGMAVTAVVFLTSIMTWLVNAFILEPFQLVFLTTVVSVLLIAAFVQMLELIIKKTAPALYNMWGIFLLLIATNCAVLSVTFLNVEAAYNLPKSIVHALGGGAGFTLALVLMASIREKLRLADVPKSMQGLGVAFILAGMLALSFLGFVGMM